MHHLNKILLGKPHILHILKSMIESLFHSQYCNFLYLNNINYFQHDSQNYKILPRIMNKNCLMHYKFESLPHSQQNKILWSQVCRIEASMTHFLHNNRHYTMLKNSFHSLLHSTLDSLFRYQQNMFLYCLGMHHSLNDNQYRRQLFHKKILHFHHYCKLLLHLHY